MDRSYNMKRATECFNNMVIMPGETISYNKITDIGGYRAALVINGNDELEMGVGGGLCQVATTLFQASVRAGLTIVESNNHTHPSEYTKLAMDAMVSGWSDLKVRNDFDFPVIIRCYAQGGENYYEILGDTEKKNYEVNLVAGEVSTVPMPVKEIEDPTVPYGKQVIEKESSVGYNVATYIYNGKTGETYKLRDNHYTARTRVVRVNKGVPTNVENSGLTVHADLPDDDALRIEGVVALDGSDALFEIASLGQLLTWPASPRPLPGLDPARRYRVRSLDRKSVV